MDYSKILHFRGEWRSYQARVLSKAENYLADGKIHIVAAPGSGKTTLGIELIARLGEAALVLVPSITIREQWVSRIEEGFLNEGLNISDYVSQDLKEPRAITVVTYQALHSAVTRFKGKQRVEGNGDAEDETESGACAKGMAGEAEVCEVDYSSFDIVQTMRECKVRVLCLDECHHLRAEWWKALEDFKQALGAKKTVALTATPPYDSTPAFWKRYMDMCGEIDEEITIPELVKEGSLCPHQDYVYFNYPTEEEAKEVARFREKSRATYEKLLGDARFREMILSSAASQRGGSLRGKMTPALMEQLLQEFLYEENDEARAAYRKELEEELKLLGLIDKKRVTLTASAAVEKLLTTSRGKCKSIQAIVRAEYENLNEKLRLLVLADYIRGEYEKVVGGEGDVTALGVLPFFEMLRRTVPKELRLAVLCGSIVVIPGEAKEALLSLIGDKQVRFLPFGSLSEDDYVKVCAVGDAHFLTAAVTELFAKGCMQVLIGTKSLLGEGWDSPCINSLILASFVGSFMLSNQMRGRAIRVFREEPDKTSNIWHLVCLPPEETAGAASDASAQGEDYALLARRMEHFLGLHYEEERIESGIGRLSVISAPFDCAHTEQMNARMLEMSARRDGLKERWMHALTIVRSMEVAEEVSVDSALIPRALLTRNASRFAGSTLLAAAAGILVPVLRMPLGGLFGALAFGSGTVAAFRGAKLAKSSSAAKRLKLLGFGVHKALRELGLLETRAGQVVTEEEKTQVSVGLSSSFGHDQSLFASCMRELFSEVEHPRYLLRAKKGTPGTYYAVPEVFGRRKEDAQMFCSCVQPVLGECELIYTRNDDGKRALLEARLQTADRASLGGTKKRVRNCA